MKLGKLLTLFTFAIAIWACTQTPSPNVATSNNTTAPAASPPVTAATPEDVLARGRQIYMDNCAGCHKENGTGGKIEIEGKSINADDLTSAKIKGFPNDKITDYIYNGIENEGMPAFKDKLSEAEIREVVRFVRAGIQKLPAEGETKPSPK